ncbi:MAG: DNA-directed RNA polymerase subunit alpha [bacterium]|nr:DNA-directed RNA polymerase subunit alpha [bacterium]
MIPPPEQPKIILEEENRGIYEIEGLYPGYGTTLGNAMRRTLLSSLEGAAIVSYRIEGINHEFSTVPGILEDVIELSLNLKQVRFKMHGEGSNTATISIKGEKEITARDIKTPSQLEVVNPNLHIATATDKKAVLSMELTVETGLGYQPVETRSKEKVAIGTVALDSSFSPVRVVNFEVENMRVGDRTDYNRVRFNIETDGSISPKSAFTKAAQILVGQFEALSGAFSERSEYESRTSRQEETMQAETESREESYENSVSKKKIDELEFSTRVLNAMNGAGIKTVGQLLKKSDKKLKEIEGLGDKGIQEIKKALGNLGITLKQ